MATESEIEKTYRQTVCGYDEPDLMWLTGATLRLLLAESGELDARDTDGNALAHGELYCVSARGLTRVK